MKPLPRFGKTGTLHLAERGEVAKHPGTRVLLVDEEIGIDTQLLQDYCFAPPTGFTYDLMTVVAAARCADREFTRAMSEGWSRQLTVAIPVYEIGLWGHTKTTELLAQTLSYLTGDEWIFKFRARRSRFREPHENYLALDPNRSTRFIPYSHGLDSFAQLRLLQHADRHVEHICVYADPRQMAGGWRTFRRQSRNDHVRPLRVPLKIDDRHHAERTFRTRPFIYYTLAAYGAITAGSNEVVIPENGQGSIGASLVTLGTEAPHRSCHPGFTSRLAKLLEHLTGQTVRFRHPGLLSTKGDVLNKLSQIAPDSKSWMLEHWSCSHDQRHATDGVKRIHCGVCGNCILRRSAAMAAGFDDPTPYLYENLTAFEMKEALRPNVSQPRAYKAFEDLASNGIRSMQRLADLALAPDGVTVWAEAANIAVAQSRPVDEVQIELTKFLTRHAQQWRAFLDHCGPNSWPASMARA
jgi:7-cyano-7-deazaguanine synthase in queuosine biosynthesis